MHLTNKLVETCGPLPPFVFWDNFFPDDQLQEIIEFCNKQENLDKGQIQDNVLNEDIRKSSIKFIHYNSENHWLFNKFNFMVEFINTEFFRFNLVGFDHFQYTVYDGSHNDHYDYHMDMALFRDNSPLLPWSRKLSFSLVLSDPSEYEGGEFEINTGSSATYRIEQQKGRIIAFPSYMIHRVKPITKGTRKSLVIWATGPRFV